MLLAIIGIFYSRYALYPLNESENVLFLQIGNSPLWFLTSMFIGCMLFYVIMEIARDSMIKTWLCYVGLIVITILFQSFPVLLPWSIDTAFLTAWFMLIGYNMKKKFLKRYSIFYIALVSIIYTWMLLEWCSKFINKSIWKSRNKQYFCYLRAWNIREFYLSFYCADD
ncbi:MAG TPA: hypothetical protein DFK11_11685 [Lachnospiraceae bacterium]|nr:hypothetical protein [Lachnospiraceae bacterium]